MEKLSRRSGRYEHSSMADEVDLPAFSSLQECFPLLPHLWACLLPHSSTRVPSVKHNTDPAGNNSVKAGVSFQPNHLQIYCLSPKFTTGWQGRGK